MSKDQASLIAADNERIETALVQPDMMEALLAEVRAHIDAFEGDPTTEGGRDEIKSMAYRITRSKTAIDGVGKEYVAEAKAKIKIIDNARKLARDTLDEWRDEVRKPVTEWEERQAQASKAIEDMIRIGMNPGTTIEEIEASLAQVQAVDVSNVPDDSMDAIDSAQIDAIQKVQAALDKAKQAEAERAELEALRKEKEDREAQERQEAIKAEAAAKAKREAEEAHHRELQEAKDREAKAEAERKLAEQRAKDAEEKARLEAKAEQERIQREAQAKAEARAKDQAHRSEVMNTAYLDLLQIGVDRPLATEIVAAIAAGQIRNVFINY